ncbi:MAG: hypothetical protein ACI9W2_004316 [Gammaproteobacteria bacterium]|jgi:hypothetical protein
MKTVDEAFIQIAFFNDSRGGGVSNSVVRVSRSVDELIDIGLDHQSALRLVRRR